MLCNEDMGHKIAGAGWGRRMGQFAPAHSTCWLPWQVAPGWLTLLPNGRLTTLPVLHQQGEGAVQTLVSLLRKMALECDLGYGDPTVHHVERRGKYFGEMLIPLVSCPQSGSAVFLRGGVPGRGGGVKRPLPSEVTGWGRGLRYPSDRRPSVKLDSPL